MARRLSRLLRGLLPALLASGSLCAAELPSALDAAGQLKTLPVQPGAGFGWLRVAGGVQIGARARWPSNAPTARR